MPIHSFHKVEQHTGHDDATKLLFEFLQLMLQLGESFTDAAHAKEVAEGEILSEIPAQSLAQQLGL